LVRESYTISICLSDSGGLLLRELAVLLNNRIENK
jgi:hypothetical protein